MERSNYTIPLNVRSVDIITQFGCNLIRYTFMTLLILACPPICWQYTSMPMF